MRPPNPFLNAAFVAVLCLLLAACQHSPLRDPIVGESYKPSNIHREVQTFPKPFRRVAVLPLATADSADTAHGTALLQREVENQLIATGRFEVTTVSKEQVRSWTGASTWSAEDRLPTGFFKSFKDEMACDAVLFCKLTAFHGYDHVRVGWRMKLVDTRDQKIWWAADELFDAGRPDVSNAARRFAKQHLSQSTADDSEAILASPTRFARYTLQSLFDTLPQR